MAGIVLDDVARVFHSRSGLGVAAVDRVSLEVRDGEFLALVGPSGCGKSTTLRLIAGLDFPTAGEIRIDGVAVSRLAARHRRMAMVFQHPALYPHLTIYNNIAFGLKLRGASRFGRWGFGWPSAAGGGAGPVGGIGLGGETIEERVREAARLLAIEPLLGRRPRELSGGERQRAALGRAIVRQPSALLLDEPLSNLDAHLRLEMRRLLADVHRRTGTTMVCVTHDQAEALALGDRVAVMNAGRIEQIGPPRELFERPASRFVAGFIGPSAMSFVPGRLSRAGGSWRFVGGGWTLPLDDRLGGALAEQLPAAADGHVEMGVRPEAVAVHGPGSGAGGNRMIEAVVAQVIESVGGTSRFEVKPAAGVDGAGPSGTEGGHGAAHQNSVALVGTRAWAQAGEAEREKAGWREGDRVEVQFDLRLVHWFSPIDGHSVQARD